MLKNRVIKLTGYETGTLTDKF